MSWSPASPLSPTSPVTPHDLPRPTEDTIRVFTWPNASEGAPAPQMWQSAAGEFEVAPRPSSSGTQDQIAAFEQAYREGFPKDKQRASTQDVGNQGEEWQQLEDAQGYDFIGNDFLASAQTPLNARPSPGDNHYTNNAAAASSSPVMNSPPQFKAEPRVLDFGTSNRDPTLSPHAVKVEPVFSVLNSPIRFKTDSNLQSSSNQDEDPERALQVPLLNFTSPLMNGAIEVDASSGTQGQINQAQNLGWNFQAAMPNPLFPLTHNVSNETANANMQGTSSQGQTWNNQLAVPGTLFPLNFNFNTNSNAQVTNGHGQNPFGDLPAPASGSSFPLVNDTFAPNANKETTGFVDKGKGVSRSPQVSAALPSIDSVIEPNLNAHFNIQEFANYVPVATTGGNPGASSSFEPAPNATNIAWPQQAGGDVYIPQENIAQAQVTNEFKGFIANHFDAPQAQMTQNHNDALNQGGVNAPVGIPQQEFAQNRNEYMGGMDAHMNLPQGKFAGYNQHHWQAPGLSQVNYNTYNYNYEQCPCQYQCHYHHHENWVSREEHRRLQEEHQRLQEEHQALLNRFTMFQQYFDQFVNSVNLVKNGS